MADRISKAFATSGDKTAIPENSTSTEVSFDEGWTSAYELEVGVVAGARDIDRGQHNQLFNIITANIKEWQEQGSPAYQSGVSYPEGAITRYTDGEYYICHTAQAAGTLPTNHSAFINAKFYGSYSYAVSQLAGGDSSLVGFIYTGLTVDPYDYLIYPGDGRIYSAGSVTGTITAAFDPDDGSDAGLSGDLVNAKALINFSQKTASITMTDATYTLSATENLYGRIAIGGTLTAEQELIVSDDERFIKVKNNTDHAVKVKTASGTGVHVPKGKVYNLRIGGGDVLALSGCDVDILPFATYGTGSFSYPFSRSESDYETIELHSNRSDINEYIGSSRMTASGVSAGWAQLRMSADASNIAYMTRSSSTSFNTSFSGVSRVSQIVGRLKEGVSY